VSRDYCRDSVGLAVLLLREAGDLQKLHKKWWYDKGECAPEGDSKVRRMSNNRRYSNFG
jgi:hypothetical protein